MSSWATLQLSAVRRPTLEAALNSVDVGWAEASHVTATASLASAIRDDGRGPVTLPVATVIDLVVLPGVAGDGQVMLADFPAPWTRGDPATYLEWSKGLRDWRNTVTGLQYRQSLRFDDCLRGHLRSLAGSHGSAVRVLHGAKRDLQRTFVALAAAGVRPEDIAPTDPVARLAANLWGELEKDLPGLHAVRDDLWIDLDEFASQSTPASSGLLGRVQSALDRAFGTVPAGRRRSIIHHGFYFFTPPQWALFQLLKRVPGVDQFFIVHDDGANPAFDVWRKFFQGQWDMPAPSEVAGGEAESGPAGVMRAALMGGLIDAAVAEGSMRIIECRSPADFVRQWQADNGLAAHVAAPSPGGGTQGPVGIPASEGQGPERSGETIDAPVTRTYAADSAVAERYIDRLGRKRSGDKVNLANLPVGSFLLALHRCIGQGPMGGVQLSLTPEDLIDVAASGYLQLAAGSRTRVVTTAGVRALRRALPFFDGCSRLDQWRDRADHLHKLIVAEVVPLDDPADPRNDLERIARASHNPLRAVPWGDLTAEEAKEIFDVVDATVRLVEELASRERVKLKEHMAFLQRHLAAAISNLPPEQRDEIDAKVRGFSHGLDEEIDLDGLVDVLHLLLGRKADLSSQGEDPDDEDPDAVISPLRGLDALGFRRADADVHLANLADGVFPGSTRAVGWPFRLDDIRPADAVREVGKQILRTREESAGLGDLYLAWLALDGIEAGRRITLSWISDIGSDQQRPSALIALLLKPPEEWKLTLAHFGGLPVQAPDGLSPGVGSERGPLLPSRRRAPSEAVQKSLTMVDVRAVASAHLCPRRFAIQWAMGPSAAFQTPHTQAMLAGNVAGALAQGGHKSEAASNRAVDDLWRHLPAGQVRSSYQHRRVGPGRGTARPVWILSLGGSKDPARYKRPLDRAYQTALGLSDPPDVASIGAGGFLPPGLDPDDPMSAATCAMCPIKPRCAAWSDRIT